MNVISSQRLLHLGFMMLVACTYVVHDWQGGPIRKAGKYVFSDETSIEVHVDDNLVITK